MIKQIEIKQDHVGQRLGSRKRFQGCAMVRLPQSRGSKGCHRFGGTVRDLKKPFAQTVFLCHSVGPAS